MQRPGSSPGLFVAALKRRRSAAKIRSGGTRRRNQAGNIPMVSHKLSFL
jgi:hypothetical protein